MKFNKLYIYIYNIIIYRLCPFNLYYTLRIKKIYICFLFTPRACPNNRSPCLQWRAATRYLLGALWGFGHSYRSPSCSLSIRGISLDGVSFWHLWLRSPVSDQLNAPVRTASERCAKKQIYALSLYIYIYIYIYTCMNILYYTWYASAFSGRSALSDNFPTSLSP